MSYRTHALLLGCALLVACGGGGGSTARVPSTPVVVAPPPPPPPPPPPAGSNDPALIPIGTITLNQHGFAADGPKRAIVRRSGATAPFTVRNDRGDAVFTGRTEQVSGADPQSGILVQRLDFSGLDAVGTGYTVEVGTETSDPFDIAARPYAALTRDALNYFYQSRFGEPVEAAYVPARTPPLTRAAGHATARYGCFQGQDRRGTDWPGCDYTLDLSGGWYDAGDYGQYAINTAAATWTLLSMAARDTYGGTCEAALADASLMMPEAGNAVPDILDEARRGIESLMASQVVSTTPQALARGAQPASGPLDLTLTDASGMVHHKAHGIRWNGASAAPADDTIPRRLYPPSTAATLSLAAVGAQCARAFETVDAGFSARCLAAAETAFAAALRVPDALAYDVFDGGGPYDDTTPRDEFGWAASELWLATGKSEYADAMAEHVPSYDTTQAFDWRSVDARGMISLASQAGRSGEAVTRARAALQRWADRYELEGRRSHFGLPKDTPEFYWGSNGNLMDRAIILAAAHDRSGDAAQADAVRAAMDYALGRNAIARSYVSGYGERPMVEPHHRFWRGNIQADRPLPPPGVLSGGPNSDTFIDPVGSTLRGKCTGMTCWRDDWDAYSLNEVAINWNASLASVAHWLDRQDAGCASGLR